MLVTILGAVSQPCVHEIAIGTPIEEVLSLAGGASGAAAGAAARRLLRYLGRRGRGSGPCPSHRQAWRTWAPAWAPA